jgi:opacity protein-like surface antigen
MKRTMLALVLALAFVSPTALAQAPPKPYSGYIAGGYTTAYGDTADAVNDGWNISGGAIMHPNPNSPLSYRVDVGYNYFGVSRDLINQANANSPVRTDDGWASMFTVTVDALWSFGKPDHPNLYIGLGVGGYRRYVQLTQEALFGGTICDPWWGICYPGVVAGDVITADDKLTKIGYNASLGMTFPTSSGGKLFVEGRFHHMDSENATEFIPITFGYRW